MKRLNPLYLLIVLVLLFGFIAYKTEALKRGVPVELKSIENLKNAGEEIKILKNRWQDSNKSLNALNSIAKHPSLTKAEVYLDDKKATLLFGAKQLEVGYMDIFLDKTLNERVRIKNVWINRVNDYNATAKVEAKK